MRDDLLHLKYLHSAMRFALPHRNAIIVILLLTVLVAGANAAEPLVLKYIFDDLAKQAAWQIVAKGLVLLAILAVLREVARGISDWLTWRTRIGLQYALLEATVGKLHNMPLRMQRSEGVGAIMTRLDRSIQGFVGAVTQILFNIVPSLVFLQPNNRTPILPSSDRSSTAGTLGTGAQFRLLVRWFAVVSRSSVADRMIVAAASRSRSGCSMLQCAVVRSWHRKLSSPAGRSTTYVI